MKRVVLLLLIISICFSSFVGCNADAGGVDTEPEKNVEYITIAENGFSEYALISPSKSDRRIRDAVVGMLADIQSLIGTSFRVSSDKLNANTGDTREVLIGECDRPATARIKAELRVLDFAVVSDDDRVYLLGGSDEATLLAVEYFLDTFVDVTSRTIKIEKGYEYFHRYSYTVGELLIGGVPVEEYKIVIPKGAGEYNVAAAKNLADYLRYNGGYIVDIVTDDAPVSEYEILIGNTNRPQSECSITLESDQYVLASVEKKLVMLGESYMVGGGVSELINTHIGFGDGTNNVDVTGIPLTKTAKTFEFEAARNALLLIGDGMGFNHIDATLANGVIEAFVARELPVFSEVRTYSRSVSSGNSKYTDSAAAATALSTGYKTNNGYIGIDSHKIERENIRELAHKSGAKTAVLTTDVITGATPSAFLAHHTSRSDTEILQKQIDALVAGDMVDFAVGGIGDELVNEAARELWTISHGGESFFAMIEEGYIDKRSHDKNLEKMMPMVKRYNELIAYCVEFVICHPDTVIVITADHETGDLTLVDGEYVYNTNEHTNKNVPLFALGRGTEIFNGREVDNIEIPKFLAPIYDTTEKFGQ